MKNYKRILIVRLDRIGDVVLSTPVIKALRGAYPDAFRAVCGRAERAEFFFHACLVERSPAGFFAGNVGCRYRGVSFGINEREGYRTSDFRLQRNFDGDVLPVVAPGERRMELFFERGGIVPVYVHPRGCAARVKIIAEFKIK